MFNARNNKWLYTLVMVLSIVALTACGSSTTDDDDDDEDDDSGIASLTSFSTAQPADDFETSGEFTINYVTEEDESSSLVATLKNPSWVERVQTAFIGSFIQTANAQALPSVDTTCTIDTPTDQEYTCTSSGRTQVDDNKLQNSATGILSDDTGSMTASDPDRLRVDAINAYIDLIPSDSAFAILDFSTDTGGFEPSIDRGFDINRIISDWAQANDSNVSDASDALEASVGEFGATPLYDAIIELCEDMQLHAVPSRYDLQNLLILTDGQDTNSEATLADAIACLEENNITAYVVALAALGDLGETLGLSDEDAEAFDELVQSEAFQRAIYESYADALSIATETGGISAMVQDAEDLGGIFTVLAAAATSGYIQETFRISPTPECGTLISGTLQIGSLETDWGFFFSCS